MEQKKIWGPEWEPQVKQTALLAIPIYIGQGGGEKNIKKGAKIEPWLFLWVRPPSQLKDVFSFACQIKLSCNQAVTLVCHFKFLLQRDRTEEITLSLDNLIHQSFICALKYITEEMKASTSLRLPADKTKVGHISNTLRAKEYLLKIFLHCYFFCVRTDEVNFRLTNLKRQRKKETSFAWTLNSDLLHKLSHFMT